ncbi:MAG: fructose-bisphosphate aldolase [Nocardia sp.]|uniref:class II fructose-bisphosphate aldolase n=1 Tax=Nocardia sp. TaxID=1821 RepID=UPI00263A2E79|nr:class II fructose-bisphosphate aldolase [Nocardia sp.]MCU1644039.1 fructose-bisphosphate aldolase [Nocardia sp.]
MINLARSITDLLADLPAQHALCAFNIETFTMARAAFRAASQTQCPVVLAYSQPAAQALGYLHTAQLVALAGEAFPDVPYALHLDHCHNHAELHAAIAEGFTSANFLNEGDLEPDAYLTAARELRTQLGTGVSLEFVSGRLGHIDHAVPAPAAATTTVEQIVAFAQACRPDILGFDHGSVHGMRVRTRHLDLDLIRGVAEATTLPQVLHGSSGVLPNEIRAGIDAGLRKINIETALRTTYMNTIRTAVIGASDTARKPRLLELELEQAMTSQFVALLTDYTLRKA